MSSPLFRLPVWRWVIGPWNGNPERELTYATSRQLSYTNDAAATAQFSLPGRTEEAALFRDGFTDLWIWADDFLCYRGRVTQTADTISENVYTLAVTTTDYRGLLSRRMLVEGDHAGPPDENGKTQSSWSEPSYADIAWGMVQLTQAKTPPSGNFGITQGTWQPDPAQTSSNYRIRNYDWGQEIGKAIDDLAGDATFDYNIRPDPNGNLKMNLWYPQRDYQSGLVLDLGGTVSGLTHTTTISNWANVTRTSGSPDSTVGVNLYTPSPEGRFEQQIGYSDVTLQDTVNTRAQSDHQQWLTNQSSLSFTMRSGVVNTIRDLDVGDDCRVVIKSGRLNINEMRIISNISFSINDQGIASTTVGVVGPSATG